MKLKIRDTVQDIEVTTITLIENYQGGHKMWNCPTCKRPIFQYRGRVVSLVPGEVPVEIPILLQCSNCKQKYLIKTILSRMV